jgi:hypothetical protein
VRRLRETSRRPTARLIGAFAAGVLVTLLVWLLVSVLADRAGPPTPTSTTILLAPTTSPAQAAVSTTTLSTTPVPTGRGPSAFTTTSAPGSIQVIVEGARCAGFVGDGWRVRYRVTNAGPTDTGSIVGRVDDSPPVILEPARQLAQGDTFAEEALLPGGGDAIVVTWVGQVERVASFPIEVPDCATDPADERAAEQATTTLGAP